MDSSCKRRKCQPSSVSHDELDVGSDCNEGESASDYEGEYSDESADDHGDEGGRTPDSGASAAPICNAQDDEGHRRNALARNLEGHSISKLFEWWSRPPLPEDDSSGTLDLQTLTVDSYTAWTPSFRNLSNETRFGLLDKSGLSHERLLRCIACGDRRPVIRLIGTTRDGNSIALHLHGVEPYFAVLLPDDQARDVDLEALRNSLNQLAQVTRRREYDEWIETKDWEIVDIGLFESTNIYGYQFGKKNAFLRVVTRLPEHISKLRRWFEDETGELRVPMRGGRAPFVSSPWKNCTTFEVMNYSLRWMIDAGVVGYGWVSVPRCAFWSLPMATELCVCTNHADQSPSRTRVQRDIHLDATHLVALSRETEEIAPTRCLSFDIECVAEGGRFPDATYDPIVGISSILYENTRPSRDGPRTCCYFALRKVAPINGATVLSFESEEDMLLAWLCHLHQYDPDEIMSYNGESFDIPYICKRARTLGLLHFDSLGRDSSRRIAVRSKTTSSNQTGSRETTEFNVEGRVSIDVMLALMKEKKHSSYSLNAMAAHYLGDQKEGLPISIMGELFNGTDEDRRRVGTYCIKDSKLPYQLYDKLMIHINLVEMCRVTGVPVNVLTTRGQQIRASQQIGCKAKMMGMVVPKCKPRPSTGDKFEGATVIEPVRGFYKDPIATLDFASLYPSIMMAHNLCYSTLISKGDLSRLPQDAYRLAPTTGCAFLKADGPHGQKGILPQILEELLAARKKAKALMKAEKAKGRDMDPLKYSVYDGRQLALKISANSVYGYTGAQVGQMPCLEISSSVTAYGRQMIDDTKNYVEQHYSVRNGYPHDAKVVYGDTDSVMILFGTESLAEAMKLGQEAAKLVTTIFAHPIKLEFEKCYHPYLLLQKKKYAGLLYTNPNKYDYMDVKGMVTVRRDNCALVRTAVEASLNGILKDGIEPALQRVMALLSMLVNDQIDLSQLVITMCLKKTASEYAAGTRLPHVELAKRIERRSPGSAPKVGDRIPYVIVRKGKHAKLWEKAEDPLYVLENDIPLDTTCYLENKLKEPLTQVWEHVLSRARLEDLFKGEHMRSIRKATPLTGIGQWVTRRMACLGCKTALPSGDRSALCSRCLGEGAPRLQQIYASTLLIHRDNERNFHRLWTACTRCVGGAPTNSPMCKDILCVNNECPIFYRRFTAQKRLNDTSAQMARLSELDW